MAKISLDCSGIENLARKLGSLGDRAPRAVEAMLIKGADLMTDGLRRGCAEYGHDKPGTSGRATGGLKESIGVKSGSLRAERDGGSVIITFNGTDEHGTRYGEIAYYLNYGTGGEHGITADHWIDNTIDLVRPLCTEAMNQVLKQYLNNPT